MTMMAEKKKRQSAKQKAATTENMTKSPWRGYNEAEVKRTKRNAGAKKGVISVSGGDTFAAMARYPNPAPPDWVSDPSKLPKKPPSASKS